MTVLANPAFDASGLSLLELATIIRRERDAIGAALRMAPPIVDAEESSAPLELIA